MEVVSEMNKYIRTDDLYKFYKNTPKDKNPESFKYLDELIHSGQKEIQLDHDIILDTSSDDEIDEYIYGIKIDVDNIVIKGNGHTIDACNRTRIFNNSGKNVILEKLLLQNGYAEDGAAISNKDGTFLIRHSLLQNNQAYFGGAVDNLPDSSTILMNNILKNNTGVRGGAIHNIDGKVLIRDTTMEENDAARGGAVFNKNGKMKLQFTTIKRNVARGCGGGVYNTDGKIWIEDSTINYNEASSNGGGVANFGFAEITGTFMENNTAFEDGGAIYINFDGKTMIHGGYIENNTAWNLGGGIWSFEKRDVEENVCNIYSNTPDDTYYGDELQ